MQSKEQSQTNTKDVEQIREQLSKLGKDQEQDDQIQQLILKTNKMEMDALDATKQLEDAKKVLNQNVDDVLTLKHLINILQDSNFQSQIDAISKKVAENVMSNPNHNFNRFSLPINSMGSAVVGGKDEEANFEQASEEIVTVSKNKKRAQAVSSVKKKPAKIEKSELDSSVKEDVLSKQKTPKKQEAAPIMADLSPIGGDLQNIDNLEEPVEPAEFQQHDSKYNIQLQETDEDLQNKLQ